LLTGYSRPEKHQMEAMYGTMGTLSDDLLDSLKKQQTDLAKQMPRQQFQKWHYKRVGSARSRGCARLPQPFAR